MNKLQFTVKSMLVILALIVFTNQESKAQDKSFFISYSCTILGSEYVHNKSTDNITKEMEEIRTGCSDALFFSATNMNVSGNMFLLYFITDNSGRKLATGNTTVNNATIKSMNDIRTHEKGIKGQIQSQGNMTGEFNVTIMSFSKL